MIITYTTCNSRHRARWSQPSIDVLACSWNGVVYEVDFTAPGIEYIVPEEARDVVHQAWRDSEDGELHVRVPSLGPLGKDLTIDHGAEETLGW